MIFLVLHLIRRGVNWLLARRINQPVMRIYQLDEQGNPTGKAQVWMAKEPLRITLK